MNHTQGKLQYALRKNSKGYSTELFDEDGETVAVAAWYPIKTETGYATNREENARRLVACWNALDGLTQDALDGGWTAGGISQYAKKLEEERDELWHLAVLMNATFEDVWTEYEQSGLKKHAESILAKYEEGK